MCSWIWRSQWNAQFLPLPSSLPAPPPPWDPPHVPKASLHTSAAPKQERSLRARPLAYTSGLAELFDPFLHLKMPKVQVTLRTWGHSAGSFQVLLTLSLFKLNRSPLPALVESLSERKLLGNVETRGHRAQSLTRKIVDFVIGESEGARSGEGGMVGRRS